ncbi:MAG TPA: sulfatase, partial [Verrucomicrobiales bacterium]|nr:sulfatase [Verrucomicrobiales bacterium]
MKNPSLPNHSLDRRQFLRLGATGMGALGLASASTSNQLLGRASLPNAGAMDKVHFTPTAKRVIFLFF